MVHSLSKKQVREYPNKLERDLSAPSCSTARRSRAASPRISLPPPGLTRADDNFCKDLGVCGGPDGDQVGEGSARGPGADAAAAAPDAEVKRRRFVAELMDCGRPGLKRAWLACHPLSRGGGGGGGTSAPSSAFPHLLHPDIALLAETKNISSRGGVSRAAGIWGTWEWAVEERKQQKWE